MIVSITDILQISKEPVDSWIETAREDNRILKVHYYGDGKAEHLKQIDGLEGDSSFNIRKRYCMSNKWLLEGLLRPIDSVFSAKGKTIDVDITSTEVKQTLADQLSDVKSGMSLDAYLKTTWKENLIVDPCGLIFLEIKEDKGYLTQKGINAIRKMRMHGTRPEYVMFEADVTITDVKATKEKNDTYSFHWFVDDAMYYRLKVYADVKRPTEILEEDSIVNSFEYVPAVSNSNIIDTHRHIKVSPIHKQIELLDKYMRNGSVHEVFLAKHGFPVFWAYGNIKNVCTSCGGAGSINDDGQSRRVKCGSCGGNGSTYKKTVSDVMLLNPPIDKDAPIITPNPAGYVSPKKEVSEDQRVEEEWTKNNIYFSLWGTTREKAANETATGRFIDVQPVNNRLNDFGDIVDHVGTTIINMFGKLIAPASFKGGSYAVGRRFMIETPDQVWTKYLNAKKESASELVLDQLLTQYYETEYQTNDVLRNYYIKVMQLDPLRHATISEVISLDVPESFKETKLYMSDYLNTKPMMEIIETDLAKIKIDLSTYIKTNGNKPIV